MTVNNQTNGVNRSYDKNLLRKKTQLNVGRQYYYKMYNREF